jgi:anti-sigma factor (TIGR02949 family)
MTSFDDQCDWCEEVMQPYLDHALTDRERREAEGHLERCSHCDKRYRFEEDLRRFVRQTVVEPMPIELKQKLSDLRLEL